ncbi:Conidiation protein 6-domain-containing protein [Cyathus striatus]|nr:Conidiation protein 6-domain-containing protein [Cyathus striatus]
MSSQKDAGNVARGLKAAAHNPRVSDEAKQNVQQRLQEMGESTESSGQKSQQPSEIGGKDASNVLRGHKAAMHNPNVSEEAKEHSEQVLKDHDAL